MKKLFTFLAVLLSAVCSASAQTVIKAEQLNPNGAVTIDGYTIDLQKNNGTTAPAYNVNTGAIRLYSKGSMTVSGEEITKIVVTLASDADFRYTSFTPGVGELNPAQAEGDTEITWVGNAPSVTFTVGDKATMGTDGTDKAGQIRFTSITIYGKTETPSLTSLVEEQSNENMKITGAVTVYYQSPNKKYTYITDGETNLEVYGEMANVYKNGDQLTGIVGKFRFYQNMPEMTPQLDSFGAATAGTPVEPQNVAVNQVGIAQYVTIEKIEITEADGKFYIGEGVDQRQVFDRFALGQIKAGIAIITGIGAIYGETKQIFPINIDFNMNPEPITTQGDGTKTNPYTVDDIIALNNNGSTGWVKGYIVGVMVYDDENKTNYMSTTDLSITSNVVIAASTTDFKDKYVAVQLPIGAVREAVNLVNNPNNIGRPISVYGQLTKYCGINGVKNTSDYKLGDKEYAVAAKLEPGTEDAPNYYILKTGRGTPYLAYSEEYLATAGSAEVRLHRTADLTQANVWTVTPGSKEGTLKITAYGTTRGLMNFLASYGDSYSYTSGAVATVVKPQDIYPVYHNNGTVSLCLNSERGYATVNGVTEYYTLDASNGSDFCGNWIPNDAGTNWSAYKLDLSGGIDVALAAVQKVINDEITQTLIEQYISDFNNYISNVPHVANILTPVINDIKGLKYSDTTPDEVETIANNAITAANGLLASGLNGVRMSLKNLRQNKFISISDGKWVYYDNNEAKETAFTFLAQADGGYVLYNEAANIYIGNADISSRKDITVATDKASALVVYPFLCKGSNFCGAALAIDSNPTESTIALNTDSHSPIYFTIYRAGDAGSIFALLPEVSELKLGGIVGKVGESIEISAVVEPADATSSGLNWSSSNPEVAAVDSEGTVWFNAAGSATVTAECQGYEFSVPFVVKEVQARALNVFPVEVVGGIGHQFSLLALHEPENTTDKSVTWESSDPEIATVSEDGRVELMALGTTQITARSGEHTAVCDITVDKTVNLTEMASTGVVIDIVEGGIVVRNAPAGESIAVYTVDGKVAGGAIVEGPETKLTLAAGIYIVKVSPATVAKVLIK